MTDWHKMQDDGQSLSSPDYLLIKAEMALVADQINPEYAKDDYIPLAMWHSIGSDIEQAQSDAAKAKLKSDWLAGYRSTFFKTTVPIPEGDLDACYAPDGKGALEARGRIIREFSEAYGEASVIAALQAGAKARGFASWTATTPTKPSTSKPAGAAGKGVVTSMRNPYDPKTPFASEKARRDAIIAFIKLAGPGAAARMAAPFLTPRQLNAKQF
jgi:hypothetical protein